MERSAQREGHRGFIWRGQGGSEAEGILFARGIWALSP